MLCVQADETNLDLSQKARLHLEQYSFPVEMMVVLPNGTVVGLGILERVSWSGG